MGVEYLKAGCRARGITTTLIRDDEKDYIFFLYTETGLMIFIINPVEVILSYVIKLIYTDRISCLTVVVFVCL